MADTDPIEVQRALKGVGYPTDRYDGPDKVEKAPFRNRGR